MADKGKLWAKMTRKYQLQSTPYEQVAAWRFGDFIFGTGFDNITSTIKARRAGFQDCIDTEDMFSNLFNDLRQKHVIQKQSQSRWLLNIGRTNESIRHWSIWLHRRIGRRKASRNVASSPGIGAIRRERPFAEGTQDRTDHRHAG